jgi:peptidoglycan/xylan/chitin deacetylase (PgdA/CDA1 family)
VPIAEPIYSVNTAEDEIYLTFDDGPYLTDDLDAPIVSAPTAAFLIQLERLRNELDPYLSATFFLNGWALVNEKPSDKAFDPRGPLATRRREVANQILAEGHDIANHTFYHRNPWGTIDRKSKRGTPTIADMMREIGQTSRALSLIHPFDHNGELKGYVRRYLRAPGDPSYWPVSPPEKRVAFKMGLSTEAKRIYPNVGTLPKHIWFQKCVVSSYLSRQTYISFNIYARDDQATDPDTVYGNCIKGPEKNLDRLAYDKLAIKNGAIILMHNGRGATLAALPRVVRYIYAHGFSIRKLPVGL